MSQSPLAPPITGRCLCGATRFTVAAPPVWASHCHCESCRRATGAAMASYLGVRAADVVWQGPARASHCSSPGTFWDRCGVCGSPLCYRSVRYPGEVHLHVSTLDAAAGFAADLQLFRQDGLPWMQLADPPPHQLHPEDDPAPVLALIRDSFAYMEGRIDPPSSMLRLTGDDVRRQAAEAEVWVIGAPVLACVFLTPKPGALYIGKLAVAATARGRGLARRLVDLAALRARDLELAALELQVRVELTDNQAAFAALGFVVVAATAHPGFDRPTSLTMRRAVG